MINTDLLWQLNNEYGKRLSRMHAGIELVARLLAERIGDANHYDEADSAVIKQMYAVLDYTEERINTLIEQHRDWRYRYYYQSQENKRVVQVEAAIHQAMARFARMRTHHTRVCKELTLLIEALPRPHTYMTSVPNGDLWDNMYAALQDLLNFDDFSTQLSL
jgi:Ser-tRNA(Ala) deacylase AlaX